MKFTYSVWLDPVFYLSAAAFALAMFLLVFSIRKYLGVKNRSDFDEPVPDAGELQDELPLGPEPLGGDRTMVVSPENMEAMAREQAAAAAAREAEERPASKAEEFLKGLHQSMASLDGRLKNIEASMSRTGVNKDFTVNFLEDMISDYETLDKEKIKARIEFLLSDLKK